MVMRSRLKRLGSSKRKERLERAEEWVEIGKVGVDSGTLLLADPSYLETELPNYDKLVGLTKSKQVKATTDKTSQIKYKRGHVGAGVITSTGFGDGEYPVYAKIGKVKGSEIFGRRVKEVKVVFAKDRE
jgi:hypothetical protein